LTRFSIITAVLLLATPAQAQRLPPDFVYLRDVDPTIAQDMRYAGGDNFTGRALPGYDAAECVLRADAAQALKRAQTSLAASGLSLKVYDCYRPERAVRAMARWTRSAEDGTTRYHYPESDKRTLFAAGWISPRSAHSSGIAVDLTLVPKNPPESKGNAGGQPRCDGPLPDRTVVWTWARITTASRPKVIQRTKTSIPSSAPIAYACTPLCHGQGSRIMCGNGGTILLLAVRYRCSTMFRSHRVRDNSEPMSRWLPCCACALGERDG
jgi:D-alanyl-D-alanine dipeptidase